ncbi:MAG: agmatinase [Flammeovirgaceae bacterium]|nr:MAG: agmatinase [Flammeovirgaceae bacterium]
MVAVIGIPLDENSSYLQGAAQAPAKIRGAYHSPSSNYCAEDGTDLSQCSQWKDLGDLSLPAGEMAIQEITRKISSALQSHDNVLCLGGDHSVSYAVVKAVAGKYPGLNILHLDAHSDLYADFEGNRYSHACPFARIMEEGLAKRLVQVGIRTLNPHQREQAKKFGVEIIEMKNWDDRLQFSFDGPVYISLDLDVLDPAFAPGVSHHEPGGLTTRQVLSIIQQVKGKMVGADIVELNPQRDLNDMTAMVAAKFFKELLARLIKN